ncbi:acyltransferase [Qipengyuania sp. 6B39]|uniref:acyltransferase family protein n=1 Tax=Qipengyuania proteolytica TaxID=2867239 RepID=UPI001C8A62CA|nr:acyltransferase [Qipengyuania proteolytica]MBX7496414.1 acyltransferase [Qipengyuania proteolytica]
MMSDTTKTTRVFFDEIVGLRIILALWVAVGHGLQLSGFVVAKDPITAVLLNAHSAVVVFMIISGFVITNLLMVKQESYPRYLTRRFFRLYPAYVLCCILGYVMAGYWLDIVQAAPWQDAEGWEAYSQSIYELDYEARENFWPHALLHASMFHGMVPDEIINRAAMVFLPAAWSISLEWQFYLVAPFVLAALRSTKATIFVLLLAAAAYVGYQVGLLGHYDIKSSLAVATPAFFLGIVSRLGYQKLKEATFVSPLVASAVVIFVGLTMFDKPLPYLVWGVFFSYLLWSDRAPFTGRLFKQLFTSRLASILGEASYSLYLVHRPVQVALGVFAMSFVTLNQWSMFAVQMAAVAIAMPISVAMYFFIEKPGMNLGKSIANRLPEGEAESKGSRLINTGP